MEVVKEGHLSLYTGVITGWQRKYVVVDTTNAFFAYAKDKASIFKSGSETIPGIAISSVNVVEGRHFCVLLTNGRKLDLKVESPDEPNFWIDHLYNLSGLAPSKAKGGQLGNPEKDNPDYPIKITWLENDDLVTKEYHLVVVACDPRSLKGIMNMSLAENEIFDSLSGFKFQTTLIEADAKGLKPEQRSGRFLPSVVRDMSGLCYGYRNETAKQFSDTGIENLDIDYLTTYQIVFDSDKRSAEELKEVLKNDLMEKEWFPYKEFKLVEYFSTPYFSHFDLDSLKKELPWKLLKLQGDNQTIYVNGSCVFDSILTIFDYVQELLKMPSVLDKLPKDKKRPIAIIGAGASGLITATLLSRMGYSNLEFLEATDRYGGKTKSVKKSTSNGTVICELGTCYLSPDYEEFRKVFGEFLPEEYGNPSYSDRSIVVEGELRSKKYLEKTINMQEYFIQKAMEENDAEGLLGITIMDIYYDSYRYIDIHNSVFKGQRPFPKEPPAELKGWLGELTFREFLLQSGLESLTGLLNYAYQVQGYGSIASVPAFYGLVWITPDLVKSTIDGIVKNGGKEVVTSFKDGWGSVWDRLMERMRFRVNYNVALQSIERE